MQLFVKKIQTAATAILDVTNSPKKPSQLFLVSELLAHTVTAKM